jgi:hypothetical protein
MTLPWTQRQAAKPVDDAMDAVREIARERAKGRDVEIETRGALLDAGRGIFPDRQVVYDSGWFDWKEGDKLPSIESFRVKR